MGSFTHRDRTYAVDEGGYLVDSGAWDEGFAEGAALALGIRGGLTEGQWEVIRYVRRYHELTGRCPVIYETCKACRLRLSGLRALFPRGYQRGACKLAGVTYRESTHPTYAEPATPGPAATDRTYRIDVRGFLVDPAEWDEDFALHRAEDLKMRGGLSERHREILRYMRRRQAETGEVPTVFDTCEAHGLELDALEALFPDGYHRGAVRLAGLRLR